jgi:hypothetical protein
VDKYDEAIEFLKSVEPGSYFDECAALMEELLARVEQRDVQPCEPSPQELARQKEMDAGALYYMKVRGLR